MNRQLNSLGKSAQKKLRDTLGFKTINQAIETYGKELFGISFKKQKKYSDKMKMDTYKLMRDEYNDAVKEQQAQKKEKKKAVKKTLKKSEKQTIKSKVQLLDVKSEKNYSLSRLRKTLQNNKGKTLMVEYLIGKKIVVSREYTIPSAFNNWWKKISLNDWYVDSDTDRFKNNNYKGNVYFYEPSETLTTKKIVQAFREGINHCVFNPIRLWITEKINGCETKNSTYSRYDKLSRELEILEKQYSNGVPEDAMPEICNKLQIDISVDLPFCENKVLECQSIKKRLKHFKFTNTRLNHVDLNEVVGENNYIEVTQEELVKIQKDLNKKKEFYTFRKNNDAVSSINTLDKQYKLKNEMIDLFNKFEIDTGLKYCKIDDIDDYELSSFIREGTNYNSTIDFSDNRENVKHIDMKKAYVKFKSCLFYSGFLGKITDYRQCDKIMGVGMYRITNLKFADNWFKQYNDKMKMYLDNNVYTSPELLMLKEHGVEFDIVSGCWGVEPLHFDFTEEMINGVDENFIGKKKPKYYAKWTGMCDMHSLEKKFWIKGNKQYFEIIKAHCEEGTIRFYDNNSGCIAFKKKHNYHLSHITAFITAYQRINVIEQLKEIDIDNCVRVCVDGIFHHEEHIELKNVFRVKDEFNFDNIAGDSYVSTATEKDLIVCSSLMRNHFNKELHLGAGGCGKTQYNCDDKGLVKVLFVAPSWKLARCKNKESGIHCNVWSRVITNDPIRTNEIKERYNCLIIDEVSMMTEKQKQCIFKTYGNMKIIMCGDLGFQLPPIKEGEEEVEEMNIDGFDNIIKYNTNYRCRDEKLKRILDKLREMISQDKNKFQINRWVVNEFKKLKQMITLEELKEKYNVNDMILCGTKILRKEYTDLFVGKFPVEKYYVLENNRLYCNGEIVIGKKPEKTNCEVRHCFTTHSIQGETAEFKLYIDSSKMFDSRMFYTAISRARYLNQIFII
jgi:hypothetical protein